MKNIMGVPSKIIPFVLVFSLAGSVMEIWGGSWDITSHLLGKPETFFTPPHILLYSGVAISLAASIMAGMTLVKNKELRRTSLAFGLKLVIIGSVIQIIAGPSDYLWHEIFGTDGLLSPTHLTLITGMLVQSVGIVLGLTRLIPYNFKITKPATVIAFASLWFVVIGFIFQFTLPISNGETINLNPDPHVAGIILAVTMPFFCVLIFWGSAKSMKRFGYASAVAGVLLFLNTTANVIPAEALWGYLPWFAIPMVCAVISDAIISKKIKFGEEIAGGLMGAVIQAYGLPLIGMAYIQFYISAGISGYTLLPEFIKTDLFMILGVTGISGVFMGIISVRVAKKFILAESAA